MRLRRRFAPFALLGLVLLGGATAQLAAVCPPGALCPMIESAVPPACHEARLTTSTLPDCCVATSAERSEAVFAAPPAPASMRAPAPAAQPPILLASVAGSPPSPVTPPPAIALYTLHASLLI